MCGRDAVSISRKEDPAEACGVIFEPVLGHGKEAMAGRAVEVVKDGGKLREVVSKSDMLEE